MSLPGRFHPVLTCRRFVSPILASRFMSDYTQLSGPPSDSFAYNAILLHQSLAGAVWAPALTTSFASEIRALSPVRALRCMGASLSMHVLVAIFTACRSLGYLPKGRWTVVTAFSGLETFYPAMLLLRPAQPVELLAVSERDPVCRAFLRRLFPHLRDIPSDATSAAATVRAPDSTIACWGSPCVTWSQAIALGHLLKWRMRCRCYCQRSLSSLCRVPLCGYSYGTGECCCADVSGA
jgi:hypothetical protein